VVDSATTPAPAPQRKVEALGGRFAVSSSNPAISMVGARVLADGGNAVDASLAMAAVGWMVLPGQCGIGGDVFVMVREPDGRVWTVNGSGFGPDGGTPDFYRGQGHAAVPMTGPLAVAVPGGLAALRTLHTAGATRSLEELWEPALALAEDGFACTAKTRNDIAEYATELGRDPGTREVFLPRGGLPEVGERIYQRRLGAFLRAVASETEGFYSGEFAERAVAALTAGGAPFTGEEWAAAADAPVADAISGEYAGATLHQTPLPTPGWMVLQQAAICDGVLRDHGQLDAASVHWLSEAARRAFRDRMASCGSDTDAWAATLDSAAVRAARADIAAMAASASGPARVDGDTTSTVCVDEEGRAVSFIHSLAFTFGARITVPDTGVVLNNRLGRGTYLIDGHPNEIRPRRKPLHTLNAWVVDHPERGLLHVGNCPGGDGQVQWNMQVISNLLDHGNDPQTAVSLPRFTVFPGSDADVVGRPEELRLEAGFPAATVAQLAEWGHRVVPVPLQVGGPGGSAMVVSADHSHGVLRAGADPRMEGVALAV
jgi:gamma-glutamyltranspeptidase / glutathione hydrolase